MDLFVVENFLMEEICPPFYMFVPPPLIIHHIVDEIPYKFRNYITQTICLKSVKGFIICNINILS
jgi:hypothetical protein